jgi:hypothetical protein
MVRSRAKGCGACTKKNEGGLRLPRREKCRNSASGGLQILLGLSNFVQFRSVLPFGFWSRAFSPAFLYRRFRVYLKEPRIPLESPLWYDRFSWQNPVRVTRPVPLGRCPLSSTLAAFRRVSLLAGSLSVLLQPLGCFRPCGLLRPFGRFRPSCDPGLAAGGFLLNGEFKLLLEFSIVKAPGVALRKSISS